MTTTEKVIVKCDYHQNHENRHCNNDADDQCYGESSGRVIWENRGRH